MNAASPDELRKFLELPYSELEKRNLEIKQLATEGKTEKFMQQKIEKYLSTEEHVKAITIAFSDMEGKLHMLDYDKKFFLSSHENLTFDGSSVKGFTELNMSDLRLKPDWNSFRILPSDVFGAGKVLMFGFVCNHDGTYFPSDFRGRLAQYLSKLKTKKMAAFMAPEIEGFLFRGTDVEQSYQEEKGFELVTKGGYFNALPKDEMRQFIDKVAEVQRALGFENEKDHGEVAPSQFEINYRYAELMTACDQLLLYKLTARQVAKLMGFTACFIPKPVTGINGSGMHTNLSITKNGKNIFYDGKSPERISAFAKKFITGVLHYAPDYCLSICSSVNAYRRLDPNFEAPNEMKHSACDRGSMVRIPLGNSKSARIEIRSVSPDANPYLSLYCILHAGFSAVEISEKEYENMQKKNCQRKIKKLWPTLHDALNAFGQSDFMQKILGKGQHKKYFQLKQEVARRSPRELGEKIKRGEVIYHHEVTNQILWNDF
ncbi:glutamine synthetase family protein [Candidatus Gracilibacteria bacterium]|nr:glutamine synthetase family protein [Candidatus Gracilibacteria bacterium]MCF7819318.1 glutamine synthetase family protein [Candidatus Gracilibacteria bacterium]